MSILVGGVILIGNVDKGSEWGCTIDHDGGEAY